LGDGAIILSPWDVAFAGALVLVAGLVSLLVGAKAEKKLAIASVRTVVQLTLVGYVLEWVFAIDHAAPLLAVVGLMTVLAGRAAVARSSRIYPGVRARAIATLIFTGTTTTFLVTALVIGIDPWYRPQYVIPLLGMILGNGLTGVSLSLDYFLEVLDARRETIEADLAMGATRWEAVREPFADAIRRGMIPILNSMAVVGIVSIPGMMTGQILQGADPIDAVKYQIVVMFMLAFATSLGCLGVTWLTYRRLFNERHQLLSDAIEQRPG